MRSTMSKLSQRNSGLFSVVFQKGQESKMAERINSFILYLERRGAGLTNFSGDRNFATNTQNNNSQEINFNTVVKLAIHRKTIKLIYEKLRNW